MKNTRLTLVAALLLAATSAAHAQAPGAPGAFPDSREGGVATTTAPGATVDSGTISNAQTTEITSTETTSSGIGPDGVSVDIDPSLETTELANTGGEPVLMSLFGLSLALGAFAVRKRVSA